jgi:glycosyltransferase involved in cell wall biosynthesis
MITPRVQNDSVELTVAIPTYNNAHNLGVLLARLKHLLNELLYKEENKCNFLREVLIIDNSSTDNTGEIVLNYQRKWPDGFPIKYILEYKRGAAFARQRAVEEAQGKLVAFLDDDVLPDKMWIPAIISFGEKHPRCGAFNGEIRLKTDGEFPIGFEDISCFLARSQRGSPESMYKPNSRMLPPGAGLVVRREAWLASVPQQLVLNYTGNNSKLASEDLEALIHIQKAGWQIWYNPEMKIDHYIHQNRLKKSQLLALMRRNGLSRHRLRMLRYSIWMRPIAFLAHFFNDLFKFTFHYVFQDIIYSNQLARDCNLELKRNCILSPFVIWKMTLEEKLCTWI